MNRKKILHVGCGLAPLDASFFPPHLWVETRLDIDPTVFPDIVGSITAMKDVREGSFDALWSSHNLEHLYAHEVFLALQEFYRVLKQEGIAYLLLPDIQVVAEELVKGNLEGILYHSPAGPISPIDVFWGYRKAIQSGNTYMAHKTGFIAQTIAEKLIATGFKQVSIQRRRELFDLFVIAEKSPTGA